jgi:CxxC-x17-CxxC domain-containing protein
MQFQDKVLQCVDCSADFIFTVKDQKFFHEMQFKNQPKRCKNCKIKRVPIINSPLQYKPRIETRTTCSQCGRDTTVPFRPTQGRPVLCRDCFQGRRTAASGLIKTSTLARVG